MKKQTIFLLLVSAILFTFSSCTSDNVSPDFSSDEASALDMLFLATADDSTSTDSTKKHGGKCDITEIDIASLPTAVTNYIATNYPNGTIVIAGVNTEGYYMIKVDNSDGTHAHLVFDADGNFVTKRTKKGGRPHGNPVATSDLPIAISTYIGTNYSTATISKAMMDDDGSYKVLLLQSDNSYLGLEFDAEGNFLSEVTLKGKGGGKKHGPGPKRN